MRSSARRWGNSIEGAGVMCLPKLIVFLIAATSAGYIRSCRRRARGQTPPRICEPGAEDSSNKHDGCLGRLPAPIKFPPARFSRSHRRWIPGHRRRPPRPRGSPRRVTRTGPGQFLFWRAPAICRAARRGQGGPAVSPRPAAPSTGPRPPDAPPRARHGPPPAADTAPHSTLRDAQPGRAGGRRHAATGGRPEQRGLEPTVSRRRAVAARYE